MNAIRNLLMLVVAAPIVALSQQPPDVPASFTPEINAARTLAVFKTATLKQLVGESTVLPPACDAKGNVYFRPYESRKSPLRSPIYKFSPQGERVAVYRASADSEFTGQFKGGEGFALGKDGEVYLNPGDESGDESRTNPGDRIPGTDGTFPGRIPGTNPAESRGQTERSPVLGESGDGESGDRRNVSRSWGVPIWESRDLPPLFEWVIIRN